VQWIVEYLCGHAPDAVWQLDASLQPHEANILKIDSSKAKAQLDWRPRWNLQTALGMTLAWHQAWKQGADMAEVSAQHIQKYESVRQ
jgi:CDP-glucose 4,6-dehydratase